jgi:hypothetical protein
MSGFGAAHDSAARDRRAIELSIGRPLGLEIATGCARVAGRTRGACTGTWDPARRADLRRRSPSHDFQAELNE